MTSRVNRVLIVDDHPIVRQGLRSLLEGQPDFRVCGDAEDVVGALRVFKEQRPDIVIVDISLKEGSGLDLVRRLRSASPDLPILVASMYDEAMYAERALAAGAQGYITKQQAPDRIVTALRQILLGRVYLSDEMTSQLLTRAVTGRTSTSVSPVSRLSDRELEIFGLIGEGRTTAEIAAHLKLSVKTVETHRLRIREKLGLADSSKLVREAAQWVLERRGSDAAVPGNNIAVEDSAGASI